MPLLFKIQKTVVSSSFALIRKVTVLNILKFSRKRKSTWYHKTFEEPKEIRKIKIHMWTVWLLTCSGVFFLPLKTWKTIITMKR